MVSPIKGRRPIHEIGAECPDAETDESETDTDIGPLEESLSSPENEPERTEETSVRSRKKREKSKSQDNTNQTAKSGVSGCRNHEKYSNGKQRASLTRNDNRNTPGHQKIYSRVWLLPLLLAVALIFVFWIKGKLFSTVEGQESNNYMCNYSVLQDKYTEINDDVWNSLVVGTHLITAKKTESPSIFLFLHNDSNFVAQFTEDVAYETSKCFGEGENPIELEKFITPDAMSDYGVIIQTIKDEVKEGSTIIGNLNKIPAETARSLHSICDTYNPLVKNVVVLLTLTHPNITGRTIDIAENALIELWSPSLKRYELDPLITRVTDQVLNING